MKRVLHLCEREEPLYGFPVVTNCGTLLRCPEVVCVWDEMPIGVEIQFPRGTCKTCIEERPKKSKYVYCVAEAKEQERA